MTDIVFTVRTPAELSRAHELALNFASVTREIGDAEALEIGTGAGDDSDWAVLCYHVAHSLALLAPAAEGAVVESRAREILGHVAEVDVEYDPPKLYQYEVAIRYAENKAVVTLGVDAPGEQEAGYAAQDGLVAAGFRRDAFDVVGVWRKGARPFYTIDADDVHRAVIEAFGKKWMTAEHIGSIFPSDVGRRIYRVRDAAGARDFLQLEGDEQYAARIKKAGRSS
jgi:hypothetical protein